MDSLKTVGLFAGIGGVELGLAKSGHQVELFCEIDLAARAVLSTRFPGVPLHGDIRTLKRLPKGTDLLCAGFPCQDLSQAGKTGGIRGEKSSLVGEVFRLLEENDVPHVLLENVPFMLQLEKGRGMRHLADSLERLGYRWAYRVVDSRAFGLPQRRQRIFLIASKTMSPWEVMYQSDVREPAVENAEGMACGFYWTEGLRGLGWGVNCTPTLKGGSTIGIPSPPAIWMPDGTIVKPEIRDAERLQGFRSNWTKSAETVERASSRWRLVGNAVSVPTAAWVGTLFRTPPRPLQTLPLPFDQEQSWPKAAYGSWEGRFEVPVGMWPKNAKRPHLATFLKYPPSPLSAKALRGFMSRLKKGNLRYPPEFWRALEAQLEKTEPGAVVP